MLRQHLRQDFRDADLASDGGGGTPVVAGDHRRGQAHMVQCCNGRHRIGFDGVGDRQNAGGLPVDRGEDGVLPSAAYGSAAFRAGGVQASVGEQPHGANQNLTAVDRGPQTFASDRRESRYRRQAEAALPGGVDDCGPKGMFAVLLRRGHQREQARSRRTR